MDKRKQWRAQEQELIARWNSAVARHNEVMAQIALAGGDSTSEALVLAANSAQAEVDALRREVARLKVQFNSGKRY
jgi:glutamate 5-kinase